MLKIQTRQTTKIHNYITHNNYVYTYLLYYIFHKMYMNCLQQFIILLHIT